ncbi:MAG TPA: HAMP domain-containing sensor histidine kinase [Acidimicrobiales bacterium]|nr:HAMP domain-containing sensor histidine kinase [Acidimicrobiales bacterium]
MRRRLTAAIVGVVAGSLLLAGLGTFLLVRRAARDEARRELVRQAQQLASAGGGSRANVINLLRRVARLQDGVEIGIGPFGGIVGRLPAGLTAGDVDPSALLLGDTVSGRRGSLVFAAAPLALPPPQTPVPAPRRQRLGGVPSTAPGVATEAGTAAVILTRRVRGVERGTGYLLLSSAVALFVAAVVAQYLARRIARPLKDAEQATRRIAQGDLATQVPVAAGDYPELTSLARSINSMAASLSRARGLERQFLMSVSHDLRTPLTSIRGFAEAISDGATTDVQRAAAVIASESRRLERLVRDLLDLAKLDTARFSLDLRHVDAAEVVADTAEGFRPAADAAGLELLVNAPEPGQTEVAADPDRLAQVVANLVENAFKFALGRIEVTVARVGSDVAITVADDGPGIAPEDLPHVFDRFHQSARTPARQMGSGLGLAIVAELVRAMGATVEVRPPAPPVGGTRIVVRFRSWVRSSPNTEGGTPAPQAATSELKR